MSDTTPTTISPSDTAAPDWNAWSREAAEAMVARNAQWPAEFGLQGDATFRWDLERALLVFDTPLHEVVATVCLVGTSSVKDSNFVWSWANAAIPPLHGQALEAVHDFGRENGLALLTTASISGGKPEAMECMYIAARLQRALGTWVDDRGDVALYFTILHLQVAAPTEPVVH